MEYRYDVFISYSRKDVDYARSISKGLKEAGLKGFWDAQIPVGVRHEDYMKQVLNASRTVLVIWSKDSVDSRWVRDEAEVGRERDCLFPIRIDNCELPRRYRAINTSDFSRWRQGDYQTQIFLDLLGRIKESIGVRPPEAPEATPTVPVNGPILASSNPRPDGPSKRKKSSTQKPSATHNSPARPGPFWRRRVVWLGLTFLLLGVFLLFWANRSSFFSGNAAGALETPVAEDFPLPDLPPSLAAVGIEFVRVPSGSFLMGSEERQSESPIHRVEISPFALSTHEVTNAQFCTFLNEQGNQIELGVTWFNLESEFSQIERIDNRFVPKSGMENYPVIMANWFGAQAFCQWAGGRLPSEAEWEYAARAGEEYMYSGSDYLDEVGWYAKNAGGATHPVGQKKPNAYGLYDMSGNVWEWCADIWHRNYEGAPALGEEWTTGGTPALRVMRGGSWKETPTFARNVHRGGQAPSNRFNFFGFRLVLDPQE